LSLLCFVGAQMAHIQEVTSVKRLETTTPVLANAALFLRCLFDRRAGLRHGGNPSGRLPTAGLWPENAA